jgi:N4-gp56 family major capsid protein
MAVHNWTADVPSGILKNHALSRDIRRQTVADAVFLPHVKPEPGYGKGKGESIDITRIASLTEPTNARLSEVIRIPEDTFTINTTRITVAEWGRSVPYTSLERDLLYFDLDNQVQSLLKEQQQLALDTAVATAMRTVLLTYTPLTAASGDFATDGTYGTAASNWNLYHVERIQDMLYDTYRVPPAAGSDYITILRTLGWRGLMRDPAWEEWKKYSDPGAKFNDEVGRLSNTRFIRTNHSQALAENPAGVLGEGVTFGRDFCTMIEALTPELRAESADFGRVNKVAWYGIMEFGLSWGTSVLPGEVKGAQIGSA